MSEPITVIVPSSPCPSHPSIAMIEETITSVAQRFSEAEFIVTCDGVRESYEHRRKDYSRYLRDLNDRFWDQDNVKIVAYDTPRHQSGMLARALPDVKTRLLMYVEHDCPLTGDVPEDLIASAVLSGDADVVRLYPFTSIEPEHEHMMLEHQVVGDGLPARRTWQWSQRPHVASVSYYRSVIEPMLDDRRPRFIEEMMASVCSTAFVEWGMLGWYRHRLVIFEPEGNVQRSLHTDGRGDDPPYVEGTA